MSIGLAVSRIEGRAKVTGRAKYAADNTPKGTLHAVIVGAPVAAGRITGVDATRALALEGVVRVLTRADMPKFGKGQPPNQAVTRLPMQSDQIQHEGEAVAIVLGETIEAAEAGREAVIVRYADSKPLIVGAGKPAKIPEGGFFEWPIRHGDVDAGLKQAAHRIERGYVQPDRHHNPIETSGTVAVFEDGKLTIWDAVQAAANVQDIVGAVFDMKPENVRVIAPHTGGGYGCKGYVWPHQILAVAAAMVSGRPVKLHLRRQDQYAQVGYQPWIKQDIALGADKAGKLLALRHTALNATPVAEDYIEAPTSVSLSLYDYPALDLNQSLERVNVNMPTALRPPVEGPGLWAMESAMDELAEATGIDPLDLRLVNYAEKDPHTGKPWSSKKLREAYAEGARLYGWRERRQRPKQDGPWRIGHGMATANMGSFRWKPGRARVRVRSNGSATVETNTHDIGTGTLTVLCQIAADELGLPMETVSLTWGDSNLPRTSPVYGSSATMSTGSSVALACRNLKAEAKRRFGDDRDLAALMRNAGVSELVAEGEFKLPDDAQFSLDGSGTPYAMRTWGAVFIEVGVDPELGVIRFRRAAGAYSAGRIINPKTARSQMTGGMIWAWGKATMEQSIPEPTYGRWLAKNLSNVAIPVNADIPIDIKIHFIEETDPHASVIGARGIGELAATGMDAAIAAAVYDAVGVRVRELPITPDKVLTGLAAA
jgi:xanthine dehydrogenase YagR molybdenum-binding subunit